MPGGAGRARCGSPGRCHSRPGQVRLAPLHLGPPGPRPAARNAIASPPRPAPLEESDDDAASVLTRINALPGCAPSRGPGSTNRSEQHDDQQRGGSVLVQAEAVTASHQLSARLGRTEVHGQARCDRCVLVWTWLVGRNNDSDDHLAHVPAA